jgi:small subunit ribosomal protein S16
MPVKIRLTRMGKKKQPSYRVVVVDSRRPRDGAYIEQIGRYDPRAEPSLVEIDNERALDWLQKGAQPTERAKKLLEISGAWTRFAIDRGEIHTVGTTQPEPAPAPEPMAEPVPAPEPETAPEPVAEVAETPEANADAAAEKVDE